MVAHKDKRREELISFIKENKHLYDGDFINIEETSTQALVVIVAMMKLKLYNKMRREQMALELKQMRYN